MSYSKFVIFGSPLTVLDKHLLNVQFCIITETDFFICLKQIVYDFFYTPK